MNAPYLLFVNPHSFENVGGANQIYARPNELPGDLQYQLSDSYSQDQMSINKIKTIVNDPSKTALSMIDEIRKILDEY